MFEVLHLVSMNLQTGEGNTSHENTPLKRQKLNSTVYEDLQAKMEALPSILLEIQ